MFVFVFFGIVLALTYVLVYRYCGIQDPSWSEIHHFAKFLDLQLECCEKSVFCDETLVGDVMSGLKGFVVKFMIMMSIVSSYNVLVLLY